MADAVTTETPVEAPLGEPTEVASPSFGDEAQTETPAAGEGAETETPAPAAAAPEIPEEALKTAAEKYAADQIKAANRTMAEARRRMTQTEKVTAENEQFKARLAKIDELSAAHAKDPRTAYIAFGYPTLKAYLEAIEAHGGEETKPPTADDRVTELQRRLDAQEAERVQQRVKAAYDQVFTALEAEGDKYDLVTTDIGKQNLTEAVKAYHRRHGQVPDKAIWALADEVQQGLEAQLSRSKRFAPRQGAKNAATPASPKPAPDARTAGPKTLTNDATASGPASTRPPDNEDEAYAWIAARMRAAGELR